MEIHKSFCAIYTGQRRFSIRFKNYEKTLADINNLLEEAKKDFPALTPDEVTVRLYSGEHSDLRFGIEFVSGADAPEGYTENKKIDTSY